MIIYYVVGIIFVAGVMGGYINFALGRSANSKLRDAWWSVVIGLGAAFLVPLFLNTISSSLLSGILDGSSKQADWFVFFGFCLLGAIASRTMIQTLTQKVLRTAEEAKQEVAKLKEEVDPIIIKETEPEINETEPEIPERTTGVDRVQGYGLVGEEPPKIIKVLGGSKYSRRTVQGIQKEAKVPLEKVYELLSWLQMNGLAVTTGEPNNYWSLTEKGRSVFANTIKEKA
jgi:hypothetical protein